MAKGGRKIYRTSANSLKKRTRKVLKSFFVLLMIAALVFLGYSIAKPIHKYFAERTDTESSEAEKPWTPPVFTEATEPAADDGTESEVQETTVTEEQVSEKTVSFSAYQLPVTALTSSDALVAAMDTAKKGSYTAIVVPLKAEGGKIYYNTASEMAKTDSNAVVGTMYAGQIASMIKANGFTAIASVNLLEDNNRYGESRKGSYKMTGDETWLDDSPSKGGKPWLSPFEKETQEYVSFIANEASDSGYDIVMFDGLAFPKFRNSDLNYIGESVKSVSRYTALVNVANLAAKAAEPYECEAVLTLSAAKILSGTEEVFKPSELEYATFAIEYIPAEIPENVLINGTETAVGKLPANNKTQTVFSEIQRLAGENAEIIPVLRQSDFSQADFSDTISAVMSLGCESYVILP